MPKMFDWETDNYIIYEIKIEISILGSFTHTTLYDAVRHKAKLSDKLNT